MTARQQRISTKGAIFALIIGLVFFLSRYGLRPSTFLIVSTLGRMPAHTCSQSRERAFEVNITPRAVLVAVISPVLVLLGYLYKDHFVHGMKSTAG
jgi:hypothetical protein